MSATEPNDFFQKRRSFTEIKQEIFGKYFQTWCHARLATLEAAGSKTMLYLDLLAGDDIEESIGPHANLNEQLLRTLFKNPLLNESVRTFIYDKSKAVLDHITESIQALSFYEELLHPPVPLSNTDSKAHIGELLEDGSPALVFLDPFRSSYTQEVLLQAVQAWRSDLFMLLRPEYITKAVTARKASKSLVKLFGERLQKANTYCRKEKDSFKRQEFILDHLLDVFQENGYHTLLFKVNPNRVEQPYHYLLFSSPDSHAYRSFKETMLPYSTFQEDGVPVFVANQFIQPQFSLFEQRPIYTIPNLIERLIRQANLYKYKSIEKIYELDGCGTNYTRDNYIAAFEQLRKEGKIELLNAKTMQTIRQPTPASVVKYRL